MKNIKIQFGKELKKKISKAEPTFEIGKWAYSVYFDNMGKFDSNFRKILLDLSAMEDGDEFELSYEELEEIANNLIKEELKIPDPSIEKSAKVLDDTWLMCPDCIDAWECVSKSAMVICPKCDQVLHNPRWHEIDSEN